MPRDMATRGTKSTKVALARWQPPRCRMIQGRSQQARKKLIRLLFARIEERLGIDPNDVEIAI